MEEFGRNYESPKKGHEFSTKKEDRQGTISRIELTTNDMVSTRLASLLTRPEDRECDPPTDNLIGRTERLLIGEAIGDRMTS